MNHHFMKTKPSAVLDLASWQCWLVLAGINGQKLLPLASCDVLVQTSLSPTLNLLNLGDDNARSFRR